MWQLLGFATLQSLMLSFGHLTLKIALSKMPAFSWTSHFWIGALTNWWFLLCGILWGSAALLWMYILKHFPFSMACPMVSLSYVFTLVLGYVFFHETIDWNRWMGVALIIIGCIFVAK